MRKLLQNRISAKVAKTLFLAALMVCVGGGLFAGGNRQAGTGEAAPAGAKKLVLYTWTNTDVVQPLLDGFNKEYAGQWYVEHVRLANALTMTINTALASGEQVDVMTQANPFDLRQRYDAGIYMGLNQFFAKDGLTFEGVFGQATADVYNFDGDYYATPYGLQRQIVFFNKKMFDEAGEPYPKPDWTWDEFRAIAKRMTKGSGASKVYGIHYNLLGYWDCLAFQTLGPFAQYSPDRRSTRYDHPAYKEALQRVYDLFYTDQSAMPYADYMALKFDDAANGMKGLFSGRFAMFTADDGNNLFLDPSYTGGNIPAGTDIGMVPIPHPVGNNVTINRVSTTSIPKNAPNPEGSWLLMRYKNIDRADLFAGPKAMHPGYQYKDAAAANAFFNLIFPSTRPGFDYTMAREVTLRPQDFVNKDNTVVPGNAKLTALIQANLSLVFNGEMSVDECLRDLKTKGDQYMLEDL